MDCLSHLQPVCLPLFMMTLSHSNYFSTMNPSYPLSLIYSFQSSCISGPCLLYQSFPCHISCLFYFISSVLRKVCIPFSKQFLIFLKIPSVLFQRRGLTRKCNFAIFQSPGGMFLTSYGMKCLLQWWPYRCNLPKSLCYIQWSSSPPEKNVWFVLSTCPTVLQWYDLLKVHLKLYLFTKLSISLFLKSFQLSVRILCGIQFFFMIRSNATTPKLASLLSNSAASVHLLKWFTHTIIYLFCLL